MCITYGVIIRVWLVLQGLHPSLLSSWLMSCNLCDLLGYSKFYFPGPSMRLYISGTMGPWCMEEAKRWMTSGRSRSSSISKGLKVKFHVLWNFAIILTYFLRTLDPLSILNFLYRIITPESPFYSIFKLATYYSCNLVCYTWIYCSTLTLTVNTSMYMNFARESWYELVLFCVIYDIYADIVHYHVIFC